MISVTNLEFIRTISGPRHDNGNLVSYINDVLSGYTTVRDSSPYQYDCSNKVYFLSQMNKNDSIKILMYSVNLGYQICINFV